MVVRNLAKALGGGLEVVPPKTSSGRRRIDLDSGTVKVLKEHGERQLACRVKAGESWHELGLVFPNEVGFYLAADTFQNRLRRRGDSLGVMGLTARGAPSFSRFIDLAARAQPGGSVQAFGTFPGLGNTGHICPCSADLAACGG